MAIFIVLALVLVLAAGGGYLAYRNWKGLPSLFAGGSGRGKDAGKSEKN